MGRRLACLVVAGFLALPSAAAACPQTSLADVEDEVMCPVCGTPLALATEAPQARRQREFILTLVGQCKSKEQIKAALVVEFGDEVLALPGDEGFDLASHGVPLLALLAAGAGLAVAARRWRRTRPSLAAAGPQAAASPATPASSVGPAARSAGREADQEARLEADLERYEL